MEYIQSNDRLKRTLQATRTGIWEWNILTGQVAWSDNIEQLLGMAPGSFSGTYEAFIERVYPPDRELITQAIAQSLETRTEFNVECRMTGPDGSLHWLASRGEAFYNEQGQPVQMTGLCMDVTADKQAKEALQEERNFVSAVIEVAGAMTIVLDTQGQIVRFNRACERVTGYQSEEVQGQPFWDFLLLPEEIEPVKQVFRSLQAGMFPNEYENCWITKTGDRRLIAWSNTALVNPDGSVKYVIGTGIDITERHQAESALKKAKAELETRVEERTAELWASIEQLQNEVRQRQQMQEELQKSQEMLRLVTDSIPQFIYWKDRNSVYLGCNRNFAKVSGVESPEAIVGKRDEDLVWHETAGQLRAIEARIMATDEPEYHVVESQPQADGHVAWLDINRIPLHDADGAVVGILGTYEDITERKRAEADLRRQAQIIAQVHDAVVSTDLSSYITSWNQSAERLYGYSAEEAIGQHISLLYAPEQLEFLEERLFKPLLKQGGLELEVQNRHKSGELFDVLLGLALLQDADGQVIGLVGSAINITTRKQAELALRQSEAQLRQQAQQLEQALYDLQRTQSQLVQSEKMSSLGQLVAGVAHEINNPVNFIYGNLTHASQYTQDLLNLLNLYQQQYPRPGAAIETEIAEIDLEFLVDDLPKILTSMKLGTDRIRQIVLSLRNFSRLDEAEKKPVDIHEGIDSTLLILQSRLKERPGRFKIQVLKNYGDLPLVDCYAGQLNQVFMNILTNAIDALEDYDDPKTRSLPDWGGGIIEIKTALLNPEWVQIRILDNGPGIPDAVCQRLFDPFFTTKPAGKGTGLGLAISYQIVTETHAGKLYCISKPEQGTEFVIEIPIRQ